MMRRQIPSCLCAGGLVCLIVLWPALVSADAVGVSRAGGESARGAFEGALAAMVDMSFEGADVGEVLRSLAEVAGLNLLLQAGVGGQITVRLESLPVGSALDLVTRMAGLGYQVVDDVLVVAALSDLAAMSGEEIRLLYLPEVDVATFQALADMVLGEGMVVADPQAGIAAVQGTAERLERLEKLLEQLARAVPSPDMNGSAVGAEEEPTVAADAPAPDQVVVFSLDYAEVGPVSAAVTSLFPGAQLSTDEERHRLVVRAPGDTMLQIAKLIERLDNPVPQISVEAMVQEVNLDTLRKLGISWESLPAIAGFGTSFDTFRLDVDFAQLQMMLLALAGRGESRLLAHPRVSTLEGEPARIFIGDRVPVVLQTLGDEGVTEEIQYIDSGVLLEITPRVGSDGLITLQVTPEVSTIAGWTPQNYPQVRTRQAQTVVRVRDGQPVVIAGLIKESEVDQGSGLPFLSRLPLLGSFFGSGHKELNQSETVIFIIPHLVDESGEAMGSDVAEGKVRPTLRTWEDLQRKLDAYEVEEEYLHQLLVDVSCAAHGGVELHLEQKTGADQAAFLKGYLDLSGKAWSAGAGARRYTNEGALWLGGGAEYLSTGQAPAETALVFTAEVGITGHWQAFVAEFYGGYSIWKELAGSAGPEQAPGRRRGPMAGFRAGLRF